MVRFTYCVGDYSVDLVAGAEGLASVVVEAGVEVEVEVDLSDEADSAGDFLFL
jgi:hypothetical protein